MRHLEREQEIPESRIAEAFEAFRKSSARIQAQVQQLLGASPEKARHGSIRRLSREDLSRRLRDFERAHAHASGEQLASAEFYEQFCRGEFDTTFGARWATCFEAMQLIASRESSQARHTAARPATL